MGILAKTTVAIRADTATMVDTPAMRVGTVVETVAAETAVVGISARQLIFVGALSGQLVETFAKTL
jgi:hypothetical protein